jgi:branched-chain amino acid transport system ATP-binding protein
MNARFVNIGRDILQANVVYLQSSKSYWILIIITMELYRVSEQKIFAGLSVYENFIAGTIGNPRLTRADIEQSLEATYQMFPRLKERIGQSGGSLSGGNSRCWSLIGGS